VSISGAGSGPVKEKCALACVAGESGGAFELGPGFLVTAELEKKVSANAWKKMVALEGRLFGERFDEGESDGWAGGHGDGDGAVELDNGGRREPDELGVEGGDPMPVCGVRRVGAGVAGGDGGLEGVGARVRILRNSGLGRLWLRDEGSAVG
jgi:hypothetical protein